MMKLILASGTRCGNPSSNSGLFTNIFFKKLRTGVSPPTFLQSLILTIFYTDMLIQQIGKIAIK